MKKTVLFLAVVAMLAVPAMAGPTLQLIPSGNVGPHYVPAKVVWDQPDFYTFCVEWDVAAEKNTDYEYTIENVIQFGGSASVLKEETKRLYAAYLNGYVGGDFSYGDRRLQNEIWWYESAGTVGTNSNLYTSLVANPLDSYKYAGSGNVRVLNLWLPGQVGTAAGDVQSMLIAVPAPGAILLAGLGTSMVGWLRRRRQM